MECSTYTPIMHSLCEGGKGHSWRRMPTAMASTSTTSVNGNLMEDPYNDPVDYRDHIKHPMKVGRPGHDAAARYIKGQLEALAARAGLEYSAYSREPHLDPRNLHSDLPRWYHTQDPGQGRRQVPNQSIPGWIWWI